jgi:TonB family protein
MTRQLFFYFACIMLISIGCKSETKEVADEPVMEQDTVAETPAVVEIDSAAIAAKYLAAREKKPAQNENPHKEQEGGKKSRVDSDPHVTHHDAADEETPGLTDDDGFYYYPTKWAEYPGGEAELDKYLADNIIYPAQALENGIQGTVYATIYLDETGSLDNLIIVSKHSGYGLEREVKRVLSDMPSWAPGEQDGEPVKSKFTLPVSFDIQ